MMHRHCCYCCLYIWKCKGLKIYFFFIEIENSFRLKYKILLLVSKRMSDFIKRITHTAWMMLDVQICYHDILTRLWPILLYFHYLHFQHTHTYIWRKLSSETLSSISKCPYNKLPLIMLCHDSVTWYLDMHIKCYSTQVLNNTSIYWHSASFEI